MQRIVDRFWSYVTRGSGCWEWTGYTKKGYGQFRVGYHNVRAPVFSLAIKLGRILNGLACHTCDNPTCCRPDHLYEGTNQSNIDDRNQRGRTARAGSHGSRTKPWSVPRGEKHVMSKLTDAQVTSIRQLYKTGQWTQTKLGQKFGVSQPAIGYITRGVWRR